MAPVDDRLRIEALVEGAEAAVVLLEDAVRVELGRIVGNEDVVMPSLGAINCEDIEIGTSVFSDAAEVVVKAICRALDQTVTGLSNLFGDIFGRILRAIEDQMAGIFGRLSALVEGIVSRVGAIVDAVVGALDAALSRIVDSISAVISGLVSRVQEIVGAIVDGLENVVGRIAALVDQVTDRIISGVEGVLTSARDVLDSISDAVQTLIGRIIATAEDVFFQISGAVQQLLGAITEGAESVAARLSAAVGDVAGAIQAIPEELLKIIDSTIGVRLDALGRTLLESGGAALQDLIDLAPEGLDGVIEASMITLGVPAAARLRVGLFLRPLFARASILAVPVFVGAAAAAVGVMFFGAMGPPAQQLSQEIMQLVRPSLISPPDATEAVWRGLWNEPRLAEELSQAGFSDERIDTLLSLRKQLLNPSDLIQLWLRGELNEDELDTRLREVGITEPERGDLKELAFFLPSPQDLITMAVREVFTPDVRFRFQLDEDFPQEFASRAERVGVSPELARDFWAAHWALPSATQGFEMLHRRIIERDDLEVLLRALDVMPFWRDRLIQLSFRPLTRVDVRRMHALGLIDRDRVLDTFLDLGFSPDDAELNTQFVEAFNAEDPEPIAEAAGLTRASVIGFFRDGTIDRETAKDLLLQLRIGEQASELFLTNAELESERESRLEQIAGILDLVEFGAATAERAIDLLTGLGLNSKELDKAIIALERIRGRANRLPTLAQLQKMAEAEIIDGDEWKRSLQLSGFSGTWADRIIQLAALGEAEDGENA